MRFVPTVLALLTMSSTFACLSNGSSNVLDGIRPHEASSDAASQDAPAESGADGADDNSAGHVESGDAGVIRDGASDASVLSLDAADEPDASSSVDPAASDECVIYTNQRGILCQLYLVETGPYATEACLNRPYNMYPYEYYAVCPPTCTAPSVWGQYGIYYGNPTYCIPICPDVDGGCAQ